ncbi:MAG: type II secretion system protein M [Pseudomonadota bacterium]
MKAWWAGLTSRERVALVSVLFVVLAFIYWLAIWRPLLSASVNATQRLDGATQDLAWMQAAAAEARRLKIQPVRATSRGDLSLPALAEQSARSAGLGAGFRRVEPIGEDRLRVTLEGISFDALMNWLTLLEGRYAIAAEELSVDRAGAPGVVDARLTLAE